MNIYITGIGGTVGSAFARLLRNKYNVAGIDRNEENVARLKRELPNVLVNTGDFASADLRGMNVLIHCAAMKHIDLAEQNPAACVENNLVKTLQLFNEARSRNANILFMSTDKAVEPNSVYGFSKAIGERMAREYGGAFIRSGNIVDSNGSVFKIWDEAIASGQPIKVTHPKMRRFFISPDNLAKRAWAEYTHGVSEIIPEMDRDVLLLDLAKEKIKEHGLDDYPIEFIGLRPGEKLTEKLTWQKSASSDLANSVSR